jgi:hypothetical protein
MNYSGDFTAQKVDFLYSPSERLDARVWTLNIDSNSPMKVRTVQQTLKYESKCPKGFRTAQQTRAMERKSLQRGPDANAMTVDAFSETYLKGLLGWLFVRNLYKISVC